MDLLRRGASKDLTDVATHFRFGENWRDLVETWITPERIADARRRFSALLRAEEVAGKRFLDIGCGSGLSLLCALEYGPSSALGVDIDEASVEAARRLLSRHAAGGPWQVRRASVFDADLAALGPFEVVHAWGVLHHTGDLWRALDRAAALVAEGGLLAVAIYRRTPLCGFWKVEKRIYKDLPAPLQKAVRLLYKAFFCAYMALRLKNPLRVLREYPRTKRGMSFDHDAHDWLGGYPYESARAAEVIEFCRARGFEFVRGNVRRPGSGLFGSGNDEFVFRRRGTTRR